MGSGAGLTGEHEFDLNIGKVLEHWSVPFAIREIIANAIDEQILTATADPEIRKERSGAWHIRDFGRGVRYQHLTQNENAEKRKHPDVIGQFGMGLKDALAVFDRRGITVTVHSPHADITTGKRPKKGFSDVITLHALVSAPQRPDSAGTEVILHGVTDADIEEAKAFFLKYSNETVLESTEYGDVLEKTAAGKPGRIYVKGLFVAEEPNFLFSYNIKRITAPLRRALNRERSNVGRTAYTDRVKAILTACESPAVATALTDDLAKFQSGRAHDELAWREIAIHACRVLQSTGKKVIFVASWALATAGAQVTYALSDGYDFVVVPDTIATALRKVTDLNGKPMFDLAAYRTQWNESFTFQFVDTGQLTPSEREHFARTAAIASLADIDLNERGIDVEISETMRLTADGHDTVHGVWEPAEQRIVIRRDQLATLTDYAGTLLHELTHMTGNAADATLEFEAHLSELLGLIATKAMS